MLKRCAAHDQAATRRREEAEAELLKQVSKRQGKLASALETLLHKFELAAELQLAPAEMLGIIEKNFRRQPELERSSPNADELHTLRKAAKLARYLAETAPGFASAAEAAKRYEAIQQAGGEWHDWLKLSRQAKEELGPENALADTFRRRCSRYRKKFEQLLQPLRKTGK